MKTVSPSLPLSGVDSATVVESRDTRLVHEESQVALHEETALVPHSEAEASNPLAMLQRLIDSGANPDVLGKMMDLAERWQAGEAKRKWTEAIAGFKSEIDPIIKRNPVRGKSRDGNGPGPIHYKFASYDDIKAETIAKERKYGIVTGYTITFADGLLHGTLNVTVGSHTEPYQFVAPIPKGVNTNSTQEYGMALSYLKRYLYCAAFDIVICGEDTDAAGLREVYENPEPRADAPQAGTRDDRRQEATTPAVNVKELEAMYKLWLNQNPDIATNDEYAAWVHRVTNRKFDVFKVKFWQLADVEACRKAMGGNQ